MTFPDIDPVLIQIGPFAIRWYALAYIFGIAMAWWYVRGLILRENVWHEGTPPLSREQLNDLMFWVVLGVLVGGRLGYVIFYVPSILLDNPLRVFAVWQGGMSFHGGLLGVIVALIGFCRHFGIPLLSLADAAAVPTPLALCFGRIANFINGELWGRPTDAPWGIIFPHAGDFARHPSQLYHAALEGLLLFVVLHCLARYTEALKRPGMLVGAFLFGYGILRCLVEPFRAPEIFVGPAHYGVTMGIALSLPMIVLGIGMLFYSFHRASTDVIDPEAVAAPKRRPPQLERKKRKRSRR